LIFLSACTPFQQAEPSIHDFTFTNQYNESFGLQDLKGKVWIADFIFTNCDTVCPPMTAQLSMIQDELKSQGIDAEIVSFSVDPEVDTPERLKEYVERFTEDDSNWNLLTGYQQDEIEQFALEEFQTLVNKPSGTDQVLHGVNFYVINTDGVIVNEFSFTDPDVVSNIVDEVEQHQP